MTLPSSLFLISILTLITSSSSATVEPTPGNQFRPSYIRPGVGFRTRHHPYHPPQTIPQSATLTSSVNAFHLQTSSAAPAQSTAASHRGAGDPCGPQGNQTDFESTLNTCGDINTTYTHAPSLYGVQCLNANPSWHQSINVSSCASNIGNICTAITEGRVAASQWNWSSGGPNCTVGVWSNPLPAAQASKALSRCTDEVYSLMVSTCFSSQGGPFNVAAVNLQTLPDLNTNGSQVDTGYPSYIVVPQTYDIYPGGGEGNEGED